ncbi:MAG: lipopolysaccharide assembly protein LapA domain-containing protein [Streptosporangiaceae bacterium]
MTDKTFRTSGGTEPRGRRGDPAPRKWSDRRVSPRLIVSALLAVLAVIFIVQNREPTRIAFLTASALIPLWGALTAVAVLGVILGYLLARRR